MWLSLGIGRMIGDTHGNGWFKAIDSFWRKKKHTQVMLSPTSKNVSVLSFCYCSPFPPPASGDPSHSMNPVTSALISGVVILGVISVGFLLLLLHLLQKSRLPMAAASGVWNPSFKWITSVYNNIGVLIICAECVHVGHTNLNTLLNLYCFRCCVFIAFNTSLFLSLIAI